MKKSTAVALFLIFLGIASMRGDTTIDPTNHYAWGANIGFTDWRPSTIDGVNIGTNFCTGFIYAANVGWIKMGAGTPANGSSYSNTSANDFGVNYSAGAPGEKNLRGFAYGANIGWINFEATGNPRIVLATGQLRGFAWSANCGWINLDDANVFVATAPQPSPTPGPSPTPTATATPTATPTATAPPTATATPMPTATATPTATAAPTATPSPTPNSQLANISTRLRVEAGDNVLIAGFIVDGAASKRLIIRGLGPSLSALGVGDALQDPTLELFSANTPLAANDNWSDNANAAEIVAAGLAPTNLRESALLVTLAPGAYTAVLRGDNSATGIGLVEVYDLETTGEAKVINISTRGFVLTGDDVMIGGLIVTGTGPSQVVIRAIGPSLSDFSVPNALEDPLLELHSGNGDIIFTNDNWPESQGQALQDTGLAPSHEKESAILISLPPGNYTALVRGADAGVGNGLVEFYKLAP